MATSIQKKSPPVRQKPFPAWPVFDRTEEAALLKVLRSGKWWRFAFGQGVELAEPEKGERSQVAIFQEAFAKAHGCRYGVAAANGTGTLEMGIRAMNLGIGDEIIVPAYTYVASATCVLQNNLVPIFVDIDPDTYNIDPARVEEAITPRTRAIMVVHIYGLPADLDPILALAREHGLKVIEDAAEMHGQTYRQRPCGSFGDISTFSFYPNKHITTGEGGMLVTDDPALAERCRSLRNLCFKPEQRFIHDELGWNFRMSNLQAALGVAQLERLDEFVARKRHMGARYTELLEGTAGLQLPQPVTDYAENIYWVYGVVLDDEVGLDAREAMQRLAQKDIGTRPFFWPMHEQPVFQKMGLFTGESHPVSERIARRGFYLPSGLALTDGQIQRSAMALREVLA